VAPDVPAGLADRRPGDPVDQIVLALHGLMGQTRAGRMQEADLAEVRAVLVDPVALAAASDLLRNL